MGGGHTTLAESGGRSDATIGMALGFVGVLAFSVSLPTTHVAVRDLGVLWVSFGRAVVAGVLAIVVLAVTRTPFPTASVRRRLVFVVAGVVVGFPTFTGLALQHAPAGHGAVVVGLLPMVTAGLSVLRAGDRPSVRFWVFGAIGAAAIVVLAIARSTTKVAASDLFLVAAVVSAGVGYTEGALVSRVIGGWQTISWAVVLALPFTVPLTIAGRHTVHFNEPMTAWFSFAYLGVVSMFLGFFAWYAGLARGGIARVSQIQLLQPLFSLVWATAFLHEHLDWLTVVVAVIVLASVAGSKRSVVAGPVAQAR